MTESTERQVCGPNIFDGLDVDRERLDAYIRQSPLRVAMWSKAQREAFEEATGVLTAQAHAEGTRHIWDTPEEDEAWKDL